MKNIVRLLTILFLIPATISFAQSKDSLMIAAIIKEANENSQLKKNAHELMDGIGPRLVGTPKMQQAHDWAVAKYTSLGITARNEKWGEWRGWERGVSHIDMVQPWVKTLEGTQLAWSHNSRTGHYCGCSRFNGLCTMAAQCKREICNDINDATNWKTRL